MINTLTKIQEKALERTGGTYFERPVHPPQGYLSVMVTFLDFLKKKIDRQRRQHRNEIKLHFYLLLPINVFFMWSSSILSGFLKKQMFHKISSFEKRKNTWTLTSREYISKSNALIIWRMNQHDAITRKSYSSACTHLIEILHCSRPL